MANYGAPQGMSPPPPSPRNQRGLARADAARNQPPSRPPHWPRPSRPRPLVLGLLLLLLSGVLLGGLFPRARPAPAGVGGPPAVDRRSPPPTGTERAGTPPAPPTPAPALATPTPASPAAPSAPVAELTASPSPLAGQPACQALIDTVVFDPTTFTCTVLALTPDDVACGILFTKTAWPNPCTFAGEQSYKWVKTQTATDLYLRRFDCLAPGLQGTNRTFKDSFNAPSQEPARPYFYVVGLLNRAGTPCYLNWQNGLFTPVTQNPTLSPSAGRDYFRGNANTKQVMLTFDAHDTPFTTADKMIAVLNILRSKGVPGTFFVTGQWAYRHGDLVQRIVSEGHTLANHTADHTSLRELANNPDPVKAQQAIEDELLISDRMIRDQAGVTTLPYFRAPSVDYDQRVLQIAGKMGYTHINYTLDPGDWKQPYPAAFGPMTQAEVWSNIFQSGKLQPGAILLQHVDNPITPAILAAEIEALRARGYTLVSLAAGLP